MRFSSFVHLYGLALVLWPVCAGVCRADAPAAKGDIWDDHLVHPFDAIVLTEQQIDQFLARLSQSNPSRVSELEKIRVTQPQRFRWEIREEMANRFFQRIAPPVEAQAAPDTPAVKPDPPSEAARKRYDELLAWLEKTFPQQAEQLKSNPLPGEARINELFGRYEPVMRAERTYPPLAEAMKEDITTQMKCDELLMELPYAGPEERPALIARLEELTAKRFDLIVLKRQLQHDQLQRRLERLGRELEKNKEELDVLKSGKSQAVQERVRELVERADKTDWD